MRTRKSVRLYAPLLIVALAVLGCNIEFVSNDKPIGSSSGQQATGAQPKTPGTGRIKVALLHAVVSHDFGGAFKQPKFEELWRANFTGDSKVSVEDQKKVDKTIKDEEKGKYYAWKLGDTPRVSCYASPVTKPQYDKEKKKWEKALVGVQYTSTIEWKVSKRTEKVSTQGGIFKNVEVLKEHADKVKAAIRN